MDEKELIDKLAGAAAKAEPVQIDITDKVMQQVRQLPRHDSIEDQEVRLLGKVTIGMTSIAILAISALGYALCYSPLRIDPQDMGNLLSYLPEAFF